MLPILRVVVEEIPDILKVGLDNRGEGVHPVVRDVHLPFEMILKASFDEVPYFIDEN